MTDIKLTVLKGFPQHFHILRRALNYFEPDERIVCLIVGGSIAVSRVDFYSDIDLYIIVQDEHFDDVFAEKADAAEAIGEILFCFIADHLPGGEQDYIVMYPGPIKFDFMYYRFSDIAPRTKWANALILKDRDGLFAKIKSDSQGKALSRPAPEMILSLNQKFWTWCWYVFGKIMRGELWEALDGIHSLRSMALLPLLAITTDQPFQGYRRLESNIDAELGARLEDTIVRLSAEDIYNALEFEIDIFCELRNRVFRIYDMNFDPAKEDALLKEIHQHWATRTEE